MRHWGSRGQSPAFRLSEHGNIQDSDRCAFARDGIHLDAPAVGLRDLPHDREAEPGSAFASRKVRLEDVREMPGLT